MKRVIFSLLVLLAIAGISNNGYATIIVHQPGPTEGKDATIFTQCPGEPEIQGGLYDWCGAWTADLACHDQRGLIQFDLTGLPDVAAFAKLQMHGIPRGEIPIQNLPSVGDVSIYQITSPWEEMTVLWSTMPSLNPTAIGTVSPDTAKWYEWNITGLYNDWKSGAKENYGIMLINQLEGTARTGIRFESSDYSDDPTLKPRLIINPIPEPVTILLLGSGLVGLLGIGRKRFKKKIS